MRRRASVGFVQRAPTVGAGEVRLHTSRMTVAHVLWWHARVQPIIDTLPERVDRGWNWLLYVPFAMVSGRVLSRRPAGYTIGLAVPEKDQFVPCALVQLVGRYPALDRPRRKSAFVWFLTTAPEEAFQELEEYQLDSDALPKRLGTIALDVAVTHSFNHHTRGRVALHADEDGGDDLLHWYQRRGMAVLPAHEKLPPGPRRFVRPSDGRYCYFTVEGARKESRSLDMLR